jgi:hypothetical protein
MGVVRRRKDSPFDFSEGLALPAFVNKKKKVREDFSFLPSALTWGHTLYILFF